MHMNMRGISIRQAKPVDEPMVVRAWQTAYGSDFRFKYPERWDWMFRENPFLRKVSDGLPIWIAANREKAVAWNGSMEVRLQLNHETYPAAFSVDTFTLPEYRGKKLALHLEEMIQNSHHIYMSIEMAPAVRAILSTLGEKPGKPLNVYLKLIKKFHGNNLYDDLAGGVQARFGRTCAALLKILGPYGLERLLNNTVSALFKLRQKRRHVCHGRDEALGELSYERVSSFGTETDRFWLRIKGGYALAVPRDSEYLNWKYIRQPHLNYTRVLVRREDEVCGLIVYRTGGDSAAPLGIICECLPDNNDPVLFAHMLTHVEKELISAGVHMIKCGSSVPGFCNMMQAHGYARIRTLVPMLYIAPGIRDAIDFDDLRMRDWLLSLGDHDIDQIITQNQPIFADILKILRNAIPGDQDRAEHIL